MTEKTAERAGFWIVLIVFGALGLHHIQGNQSADPPTSTQSVEAHREQIQQSGYDRCMADNPTVDCAEIWGR